MKNSIGSFEAKTKFATLIKRASKGEEIVITKRGEPIAKIVPITYNQNLVSSKTTIDRLKSLAKELELGKFQWSGWKNYRDVGRK